MSVFNPEEFKVKFRALFALISFVIGMVFISLACFSETAAQSDYTGTIIGFICGTMITLILTYYFGSSDNGGPILVPPVNPKDDLPNKPEVIDYKLGGAGSDAAKPNLKKEE